MTTKSLLLPCPCCGSDIEHTSTSVCERIDCMCGISMEAITFPVLMVKWNTRRQPKRREGKQK